MPLYDFRCPKCGARFEELLPVGGAAPCPVCGEADGERLFSSVAPPATFGLRGAQARRSNAARHAREEAREEARRERRGNQGS